VENDSPSRRKFVLTAAGAGALAALRPAHSLAAQVGSAAELGFAEIPDGALAEQLLYALPGKVPLIKKTFRPPNFETPVQYFRTAVTPNKAFFVRWHLAGIPQLDANKWRLSVGGDGAEREVAITLGQLKKDFKPVEITAVCQCSGNRRGLFEPHVPGVEWGAGAMGNARWRGARLKDILAKAGVKAGAVEVSFDGADMPPLDKTPDFVKSLPVAVAQDENVLVAYEMNGAPLPHFNGYPVRLVVPGWTGTYWVKQLVAIKVISQPEKNFWMSTAYRIPRGKFNTPTFESQLYSPNEPITAQVVNSLVTSLRTGQQIRRGKPIDVKGVAWDRGTGIAKVEVSVDSGATWNEAKLGKDLGRFSFREFAFSAPMKDVGSRVVMARATARSGETQVEQLIHNPAGYHHNVIQRIYVEVV
jgi:DMSO/TMAO reductase YedYZ molybdopterin-dependent catalytic subunit